MPGRFELIGLNFQHLNLSAINRLTNRIVINPWRYKLSCRVYTWLAHSLGVMQPYEMVLLLHDRHQAVSLGQVYKRYYLHNLRRPLKHTFVNVMGSFICSGPFLLPFFMHPFCVFYKQPEQTDDLRYWAPRVISVTVIYTIPAVAALVLNVNIVKLIW